MTGSFLHKFTALRNNQVLRLALSSFLFGLCLPCAGLVLIFWRKADFPLASSLLILAFAVLFLGEAVSSAKKIESPRP